MAEPQLAKTLQEFRFAVMNAEGMLRVESCEGEQPRSYQAPLRVAVYLAGSNSPAFYADVVEYRLYPFRPAVVEDKAKHRKGREAEDGEVIFAIMLPPQFELVRHSAHVGTVNNEAQAEVKAEPVPEKRAGYISQSIHD